MILEINKLLMLHLIGSSILLYLMSSSSSSVFPFSNVFYRTVPTQDVTMHLAFLCFIVYTMFLSSLILCITSSFFKRVKNVKGKAVPLQAWSGPEVSRKLKVPRFHDNDTGWW